MSDYYFPLTIQDQRFLAQEYRRGLAGLQRQFYARYDQAKGIPGLLERGASYTGIETATTAVDQMARMPTHDHPVAIDLQGKYLRLLEALKRQELDHKEVAERFEEAIGGHFPFAIEYKDMWQHFNFLTDAAKAYLGTMSGVYDELIPRKISAMLEHEDARIPRPLFDPVFYQMYILSIGEKFDRPFFDAISTGYQYLQLAIRGVQARTVDGLLRMGAFPSNARGYLGSQEGSEGNPQLLGALLYYPQLLQGNPLYESAMLLNDATALDALIRVGTEYYLQMVLDPLNDDAVERLAKVFESNSSRRDIDGLKRMIIQKIANLPAEGLWMVGTAGEVAGMDLAGERGPNFTFVMDTLARLRTMSPIEAELRGYAEGGEGLPVANYAIGIEGGIVAAHSHNVPQQIPLDRDRRTRYFETVLDDADYIREFLAGKGHPREVIFQPEASPHAAGFHALLGGKIGEIGYPLIINQRGIPLDLLQDKIEVELKMLQRDVERIHVRALETGARVRGMMLPH